MDTKKIKELIKIAKDSEIAELKITDGDFKIKIVSQHSGAALAAAGALQTIAMPAAGLPHPTNSANAIAPAHEAQGQAGAGEVFITAPLVGVFKSLEANNKAALKIGDKVAVGQPICVVEAMKLINEIESTHAGEVIEILANEGDMVEYGQNIIKLRTN